MNNNPVSKRASGSAVAAARTLRDNVTTQPLYKLGVLC
jgi:hypothetical protein